MSDKSKLGFNINPNSYDELNSTDNLIASGSDSGWLGKKLQGDNNNTIDLSKINPLFDKELYERYRPGVNTNDGSVNQDIWGYKCFNSPVSFRNGIYGDTYSVTEHKSSGDIINLMPETYATIKSDTTIKNKIYNRTDNNTNNYSEYTYKKYHGPVDYDNSQFTHMDTVIPDSDDHTISDIIIKSHSESHCDNNAFAINDEYERTLCSVRPNYYVASAPDVSDAQYVYSANYANTQYERKLQAYTPAVSTDNYFLTEEKNVTATFSMRANSPYTLNYGDEPEAGADILLETNRAKTVDGAVSDRYASCVIASPDYIGSSVTLLAREDSNKCNIEVTANYIQIGAADGDFSITNDKSSHIFVLNNRINKSISGKAIDIDYHVKDIVVDYLSTKSNITGPAIDIVFDYRKTSINGQVDSSIETYCLEAAYPATYKNLNGVASINVAGIYATENENNLPVYKKYCGTYITPTSITTNGIQFDMLDFDDIRDPHSTVHNKLIPVARKFDNIDTLGLQLFACTNNKLTSFICDYLEVNKSIKCSNILGSGLAYINPKNNVTTDVLTVSNENLILPRGNKEVTIGNSDNQLNEIYANILKGTADKAKADEGGHNIATTYFNKNSNNTITGTTTISRSGDVLRILPNSLDEDDHCSINIITSDVDMQYKTTLNVHQQDNTNLACSLSLYAYHNNDVSSFSILPSVESTTSGILNDSVALNIGDKNNYFTNIYCKKFPTITGEQNTTSVGNIRLLAIKSPYIPDTNIHETIGHGSEIQSPIIIDGKEFVVYIATLGAVVENYAHVIKLTTDVDSGPVAGKWRLLSSVDITNGLLYIPVLAMRVE